MCLTKLRHNLQKNVFKTCGAQDGTHQCFLSPHQLFYLIVPAEHFSKPPYCVLQVTQLHVVSSPQWDLLKGTHSMPVQEKTWNSGAHRVHQAGKRLDLKQIFVFSGFLFRYDFARGLTAHKMLIKCTEYRYLKKCLPVKMCP